MAQCRLVDQSCLHYSLGHWVDAVLHLPMHTTRLLLATHVPTVQDLTTIADQWAMPLCNTGIGCSSSDFQPRLRLWHPTAASCDPFAASDADEEKAWIDCGLFLWSPVSLLSQQMESEQGSSEIYSSCVCEIVRIWLEVTVPAFADPTCMVHPIGCYT